MATLTPGQVGWFDLTVPNAESVRSFYEKVVGWTSESVDMGGYDDHCMTPPGAEQPVAGICHARGMNADLPPHWLLYITVVDLEQSLQRCVDLGGVVITSPREAGSGRCAIIRDPAGAVCALYQTITSPSAG